MEPGGDPALRGTTHTGTSFETLGDLLLTLYEMGFSERQVRDALHAGCLSAPEAANWLLQEKSPEMKLRSSPWGAPDQQAMDAFNPPRQPQEALPEQATASLGHRSTGSQLDLAEGTGGSLGRAGRRAFAEQQREQLAEQLKAERRDKRRELGLALQRIADDRRRVQAKAQLARGPPVHAPPPDEGAPSSDDSQCLLTIRLPTGDTSRQRFCAGSTLESVRQRILAQHPELSPSCSFLQSFPKRRFAPPDLLHSLQALGLTPSATLCLVYPVPEPLTSERTGLGPSPEEMADFHQEHTAEGRAFWPAGAAPTGHHSPTPRRDPGSAAEAQGPGGPTSSPGHRWGKGQRLESEEPMEQEPLGAAREAPAREAHLPPGRPRQAGFLRSWERAREVPSPPHRWPAEGNLLRPAEGSRLRPLELPLAAAQAAELRLQQAAAQRHEGGARSGPVPGRQSLKVPSLFQLCLRGTIALLSAPCKQYCCSLGALTPGVAERLIVQMTREGLLNPRSLKLFFGCPLQKLLLDCYPYATNELLRQLWAFPSLRHLSLVSCSVITDEGLSELQHLSRLQHLNLSACPKLTDGCLRHLQGLPELSHLTLDQTRVSDGGLAEFLCLEPPSLTHLSLNQTAITDSTLHLLPPCAPRLCVLSVKQTGVTDVSALRQLEALQALHLDGTCVSEASLVALSSHPSLSRLTLSDVRSVDGDRALEIVSGLPLAQLSLPSRHSVTDAGLAALRHLVGLLELDLTDYTHITDQGLQHLPQLGRLRRLLLGNTQITDSGLRHVWGLLHLEELCLDRLNVSSTGVARCIVTLPHLQVLSLASTPVGDTVARLGVAHCRQLHKLNMSRTRLTDRGLRFLRQAPLAQLNLDGSGVTALGVADFLAACPTVASIRINHLRVLPPGDVSDEEGAC